MLLLISVQSLFHPIQRYRIMEFIHIKQDLIAILLNIHFLKIVQIIVGLLHLQVLLYQQILIIHLEIYPLLFIQLLRNLKHRRKLQKIYLQLADYQLEILQLLLNLPCFRLMVKCISCSIACRVGLSGNAFNCRKASSRNVVIFSRA